MPKSEAASPTTTDPAQARADDINEIVVAVNSEVKPTVKTEKMSPSEFGAESQVFIWRLV